MKAFAVLIHVMTVVTLSLIISGDASQYQELIPGFWYLLAMSSIGVYYMPVWLTIPALSISVWFFIAGMSPAKFALTKSTLLFVIGV